MPINNRSVIKLNNQSNDLKKYYRLHGARIAHEQVIINLKDYHVEIKGGLFLLWKDCDWLNKETLLCNHHENKPLVCKDLDENTTNKYYVTTNCRFKQ